MKKTNLTMNRQTHNSSDSEHVQKDEKQFNSIENNETYVDQNPTIN